MHEVVSADQLDAKVAEITLALVSASPNAVRSCKTRWCRKSLDVTSRRR